MNIKPKFQLNFHPRDAENLTLVTAKNIMLSNDGSCLTNEESIRKNTVIEDFLTDYYITQGGNESFQIVGVIPCSDELVLICTGSSDTSKAQIFRYREKSTAHDEGMKLSYGGSDDVYFAYHNGKIKGTFTYNVENSLIVAIAEYDGDADKIPLRTINLGNYDDETIYNDTELPDQVLSITPEVRLPTVSDITYIPGSAYKGWYYLFIRYKINSVDYTQWYSIGRPVYVDTLEKFAVTKYGYGQVCNLEYSDAGEIAMSSEPTDGYCVGCSDWFSNDADLANETFKFNLSFPVVSSSDSVQYDYKYYQIGLFTANKSANRAYRTADILFERTLQTVAQSVEFIVNLSSYIESSVDEFITENYNYFNVSNIINYKNRLYIANYDENNANDDSIAESGIIDNIRINLITKGVVKSPVSYDFPILTAQTDDSMAQPNQYETTEWEYSTTEPHWIDLATYLNVSDDTQITISGTACTVYSYTENAEGGYDFTTTSSPNQELTVSAGEVIIMSYNSTFTTPVSYSSSIPGLICFRYTSGYGYNAVTYILYKYVGIDIVGHEGTQHITLNCDNLAVNGSQCYTNPQHSFDDRRKGDILVPGGVYNFFIHFVDKYGHSTNGYKINPTSQQKWYCNDDTDTEVCPFTFDYNDSTYYASIPVDDYVTTNGSTLNLTHLRVWRHLDSYTFSGEVTDDEIINAFSIFYESFAAEKYVDVRWFQLASCYTTLALWHPYYNSNGDALFRVPVRPQTSVSTYYGFAITVSNVTVPDGYVGFFLSYEKFEPVQRTCGMLTRNDFRSQSGVQPSSSTALSDWVTLSTANCYKSNCMYFYCSKFDIDDSIKLDYNIMRIDGHNVWDKYDIPEYDFGQRNDNFNFCWDMNKPEVMFEDYVPKMYAPPKLKLCVANSAEDARMGLGTALQLEDAYSLFRVVQPGSAYQNYIDLYKVTFLNASRDIYMSENKTLVRCSDIIYGSTSGTDNYYMNGCVTYDGFIVYENAGFVLNTGDNVVRRQYLNSRYYPENTDEQHTYAVNVPFLAYVQLVTVDNYFYEAKCFNNEPTGYYFYVHQDTDSDTLDRANENNTFASGCLVAPADSTDLFQNRSDSSDALNPKTYTNYREDLVSIDEFDKTVRRSAVIADETRENGWRTFPTESYKNITENKGIITNLVGLGTALIVHTQHSMFMFNTENTLSTNDSQQLQLAQLDTFDVDYTEIVTSSLGYGGLQDDKAAISDQFGYIFYNNDFNRFYCFDNNQMTSIDGDITLWLDRYTPYNVRFANDKFNSRLLIKMNYLVGTEEKTVVMSYSYTTSDFISLHDYEFDEGFNTKTNLYLKCEPGTHSNCSFHQFVHDGSSYGSYDNVQKNVGTDTVCPTQFGIILNSSYDTIKFLEYITYKLSKCADPTDTDYTNIPVEELVTPYSGDYLRVYNNEVNTGSLDIAVSDEDSKNVFGVYDKPYWELGNWNFSYLRNNVASYASYGDAFEMSRLYGNYFVIEFTWLNTDGLKKEFEELQCRITV